MAIWIFFPNLGIWIQVSGAAGDMPSMAYFSKFWKIRAEDSRLSLILRFNIKLRGYSIWSASFIAPHIK
jgi:hypothetical protein